MLSLDFTRADLHLPAQRSLTRRASISGVQDKVQLKRTHGRFAVVESGGDYILKPVPQGTSAQFAADIPENEHLTMQIAAKVFGIHTAENELVTLADGEFAYLTKRFDRRAGQPIRQEDFCQLSNRTVDTHGSNYKYDASYEELASLMRTFCPSVIVENPKVFFLILFNYLFSNGDAHLKNFSLLESPQGDYVLTPAYDLLNTHIHFPGEPTATGLDFFIDGHFSSRYEELGFYSTPDFIELGACFSVEESEVHQMIGLFSSRREKVEQFISQSFLSPDARALYLAQYRDRLRAFAC